jgi:DNA-binding MarR family transcriptional regulator
MKMNNLCALRDINRVVKAYEQQFFETFGISLNEGMVICCINQSEVNSSDIASAIDLTMSNCSKIIKSIENKGLITRAMGIADKRHMFFKLTDQGKSLLADIHLKSQPITDSLSVIFENH